MCACASEQTQSHPLSSYTRDILYLSLGTGAMPCSTRVPLHDTMDAIGYVPHQTKLRKLLAPTKALVRACESATATPAYSDDLQPQIVMISGGERKIGGRGRN